jgi:hypothetical protein
VLEGPVLASFEKERDRVEAMMQRKAGVAGSGAPAKIAQSAQTN